MVRNGNGVRDGAGWGDIGRQRAEVWWDGMGWDGATWDGTGMDEMGTAGRDGIGWGGNELSTMGWDGMEWDVMGRARDTGVGS